MPQEAQKALQRSQFEGSLRALDGDKRQVELSFSSEEAYGRWFGSEILSHAEGAVNLKRLSEIGVLLFNHKRDVVIGKIVKVWIENMRGKAIVEFDADDASETIYQKVKSGTLKGVSVNYDVAVWEEVAANKKSSDGRFTGPCYIATNWEPYEISIVSVPADATVGVGRSFEQNDNTGGTRHMPGTAEQTPNTATQTPPADGARAQSPAQQAAPATDNAAIEAVRTAERARSSEITTLCRDFGMDPTQHINSGATVDAVRAAILDNLKLRNAPLAVGNGVTADEADKVREAASDAILMRGGIVVLKPAEGARELRGLSLRDLAIDALSRAGEVNAHRLSNDEILRRSMSPDSQFVGILSTAANKSMSTGYTAAETTYQAWTGTGSLSNFKASEQYQISEAGALEKINQKGEFKFDEVEDVKSTAKLLTYGKKFGFTRQALINDDLSMLTKVPEAYARSARRGINKAVYAILNANAAIYDGTALFHADHANLASSGTKLGTASVSAARTAMRKQTNLRKIETLNITPKFLIVPAALETDAQVLLASLAKPEGTNSNVANVFRNSLDLVVDAELDGTSATAHFFAANPGSVDGIQVSYLNGNDMPTLESRIGFDYLGIEWRIFIDYGVDVIDFRGLYKDPGSAT